MPRKPAAKSGILIDVARVVSVGRNRSGEAVPRFRDTKGRLVAVKLRPQQFRTLANGVLGLAEALEEGERERSTKRIVKFRVGSRRTGWVSPHSDGGTFSGSRPYGRFTAWLADGTPL